MLGREHFDGESLNVATSSRRNRPIVRQQVIFHDKRGGDSAE